MDLNDKREAAGQAPYRQHSSHWGAFSARMVDGRLDIRPFPGDGEPSALLNNIPDSISHPARLRRPLVRKGWLEDGPGPDARRGTDSYVEMGWPEAIKIAATELRRLGAGTEAAGTLPGTRVFGGSYGWSSAGRFHHAQGQVHRFLNTVFGGYVGSVDTYSSAAGAVILSYVYGNAVNLTRDQPWWQCLAEKTELVLAFGGLPLRNTAVSGGGNSQHVGRTSIDKAIQRGCRFVSISPLADDMPVDIGAEWIAPRPGTDTALMLGMAYRLMGMGRVDHDYLSRYTTGYEKFAAYLDGQSDGVPKTQEWAAQICGIPAGKITELADLAAASSRTLVNVTYSLQRARGGEQPVWMALVLASMLGQGREPGGGFSYGLGSIGNIGKERLAVPLPTLPQGRNGVKDFIPVARISDLLLKPGEHYTYKGETRKYTDIRLVYWAGGNPFHHHQNLQRLAEAFSKPDTIIVHETVSTATTRHADIVFPATITAERLDIGAGGNDPFFFSMEPLVPPPDGPRDDYAIFSDLAEALGCGTSFTGGCSAEQWLKELYEPTRNALAKLNVEVPDYEGFRQLGMIELPLAETPGAIARFHNDPTRAPLETESGLIEIFSPKVAAAGFYGHPVWTPPEEWLGSELALRHRFQLVANQPALRLHSQLDFGAASASGKSGGREIVRMSEQDAKDMGIVKGDTLRLWNDRGAVLAAALPSSGVAKGVVQLCTGAWYAPLELQGSGMTCVNGNPNMVTSDVPASDLSQGCAGQLSLVSVDRWSGPVPPVVPHEASLQVKGQS